MFQLLLAIAAQPMVPTEPITAPHAVNRFARESGTGADDDPTLYQLDPAL